MLISIVHVLRVRQTLRFLAQPAERPAERQRRMSKFKAGRESRRSSADAIGRSVARIHQGQSTGGVTRGWLHEKKQESRHIRVHLGEGSRTRMSLGMQSESQEETDVSWQFNESEAPNAGRPCPRRHLEGTPATPWATSLRSP